MIDPSVDDDREARASGKPTILTFARFYLPGYKAGGPVRTLAHLADRLSDTFDFRIVTSDRDLGATNRYPEITNNTWIKRGTASVRYVGTKDLGVAEIARIVRSTPHDVIYLNSFFDPRFTQRVLVNNRLGRLAGKPIVLAPRGELSENALKLGRMKKKVFIWFARKLRLYDGIIWQASSLWEADDIRRVLAAEETMAGTIVVTANVASYAAGDIDSRTLPLRARRSSTRNSLRVCFLSRISPMKNLDYALRVLAYVQVPVTLSIYGPIEDQKYWRECQAEASKLPTHIEVAYKGPVEPPDVVRTLAEHDLFFFPTRGENFGHVIHEALSAGLPLLISDQTPWKGLEGHKVGWEFPLGNKLEFAHAIERVARLTDEERQEYSQRSRTLAYRVGASQDTIQANRQLFLAATKWVRS